jgi:hypothetical protein
LKDLADPTVDCTPLTHREDIEKPYASLANLHKELLDRMVAQVGPCALTFDRTTEVLRDVDNLELSQLYRAICPLDAVSSMATNSLVNILGKVIHVGAIINIKQDDPRKGDKKCRYLVLKDQSIKENQQFVLELYMDKVLL